MERFEILKNRQMMKLALANVPTGLADWLDYVLIIALFSHIWQADMGMLLAVPLALALPRLLVGPVIGALVDTKGLRQALVLSNMARALIMLALITFPSAPWLLLLMVARGLADSALNPARIAAVQTLIKPEQLTGANALMFGLEQLGRAATPFVAVGLVLNYLPTIVLAFSAGVSLLSALVSLTLRFPETGPRRAQLPATFMAKVFAGFAEIKNISALARAIALMAASLFGITLYLRLTVQLAMNFGFLTDTWRFNFSAIGAGGVLGAALILVSLNLSEKSKKQQAPMKAMVSGTLLTGFFVALVGLFSLYGADISALILIAGIGLTGVFSTSVFVSYRTIVQRNAPRDKTATIAAIAEAIFVLSAFLSAMASGLLLDQFGIGGAFVASGIVLLLVGLIGVLFSARQK